MEHGEDKGELEKQNESLKQRLQEYKALEEDMMANRVFEKAKKQLWLYITVGGVLILVSGFFGFKELRDRAAGLVQKKVELIAQEEIMKILQKESERQVTALMNKAQDDIIAFARQQADRITLAGQPLGGLQEREARAPTKGIVDYTNQMLPVRNQGDEASTVGFAAAAALEYQIEKTLKKRIEVSPRYIYYYARLKGERNTDVDAGAQIKDAVDVLRTKGPWRKTPGLTRAASLLQSHRKI